MGTERQRDKKMLEALLPYVEPDNYGEGTDQMRRENAAAALAKVEPLIRQQVLDEVCEWHEKQAHHYRTHVGPKTWTDDDGQPGEPPSQLKWKSTMAFAFEEAARHFRKAPHSIPIEGEAR